jgi:hypothetical protein
MSLCAVVSRLKPTSGALSTAGRIEKHAELECMFNGFQMDRLWMKG